MAYGCATTQPPTAQPPRRCKASPAGTAKSSPDARRPTARSSIRSLLTAAHRTFPFGTILDITNPKTSQTVRVRVNDRGPYIGNRMIDLSYAAAQQIGLIEPGVGAVDITIVQSAAASASRRRRST